MTQRIKGDLVDFALVEDGGVRRLKIWEQHLAEDHVGRPLQPDEFPRIAADGSVSVEKSILPMRWENPEVRDVVGPAGELFLVSENGDLISKRSNKIVKQNPINQYPGHVTKVGGRSGTNLTLKAHRCVAMAFIPNPDNLPEVNHLDGDKLSPKKDNLEWVSRSDNKKHAVENGLQKNPKGHDSPLACLTKDQVDQIRLRSGSVSNRKLAVELGVSRSTVDDITNSRRY